LLKHILVIRRLDLFTSIHIVIGIDLEGRKDILGILIGESESAAALAMDAFQEQ